MNLNFFLIAAAACFSQVSAKSDTYVGAVVEYHPIWKGNNEDTVGANVMQYMDLIKKAKTKNADIVVFPENGLNNHAFPSQIPDPDDKIIPCNSTTFKTTKAVKNLSCAAKENEIYTVVNLREVRKCDEEENCPQKKEYIFNTNVVFDRKGMVIARYAKFNLFDEVSTDRTLEPELSFFDTDFGVRFGIFICFDILFSTPALKLADQYRITDFVFSTHWFSELPFLTALQTQRGWSETNNVNLLASGLNEPSTASFGSGIFNGKYGTLVETMPEINTTKLLVANVPKIRVQFDKETTPEVLEPQAVALEPSYRGEVVEKNETTVPLLKDQMHLFTSEIISEKFEKTICSRNEFCCTFKISMKKVNQNATTTAYNYRAVVSNAVRKFGKNATGGIQACGVVACDGPNMMDCAKRIPKIPGIFQFTEIFIKGDFLSKNSFQMPSTLTDGVKLRPLPANKYQFKKEAKEENYKGKKVGVSLELLWSVNDLHTFGIWGRDFTRDGDPPTVVVSNAPVVMSSSFLFLVSFVLVLARTNWQ